MIKNLILFLIISSSSLIGFGQEAIPIEKDSTMIDLPLSLDSVILEDYFIYSECKTELADSLSILINTFQDKVISNTYDATINYTYQFTKTFAIELSFRSKLSSLDECFVIEDPSETIEFSRFKEFILYNNSDWLIVVINGVPRIGNSTYITDSYLYFKRE